MTSARTGREVCDYFRSLVPGPEREWKWGVLEALIDDVIHAVAIEVGPSALCPYVIHHPGAGSMPLPTDDSPFCRGTGRVRS